MDEIDSANKCSEHYLNVAKKNRRPELKPCGYCWNCEEPTNGVFCCFECGQDFEKRSKFNG